MDAICDSIYEMAMISHTTSSVSIDPLNSLKRLFKELVFEFSPSSQNNH